GRTIWWRAFLRRLGPTLGQVLQDAHRDILAGCRGQRLPPGHSIDFEDIPLSIFAEKQVHTSDGGPDDIGGPECQSDLRRFRVDLLGAASLRNVRSPAAIGVSPHGRYVPAPDHKNPKVPTEVRDELLQVKDGLGARKYLKSSPCQVRIANSQHSTP